MKTLIEQRLTGGNAGIYSVCSANEYVLEAALEMGAETGSAVLIEATANQCDQFGGYTGMKPSGFVEFVHRIAGKARFDRERLILGGDHLGPLTWNGEPESSAMPKAEELVRQYVLAGFSKIHLDTSMRLQGDPERLSDSIIAGRAVRLARAAEEAFAERARTFPETPVPVYVIGSEVPIPGGTQSEEELTVTSPEHFSATYEAFKAAFYGAGLENAFERVIGVVVQPGVEFGDEQVDEYDRSAAASLTKKLSEYGGIVFEGHSTDYQPKERLREMVEDGIAILKVGPALTFHFREAVFALADIESELGLPEPSQIKETLEKTMLRRPQSWVRHYHGSEAELAFKRKYSLSDRCRYYFPEPEVKEAFDKLIANINSTHVPVSLLSQYLPTAYSRLRGAGKPYTAENLIKSRIKDCIEDYIYAITR